MVIGASYPTRTEAPGRRTLALASAVNHVLSAHGLPMSRLGFGQATSQEAIHEAVNEALMRRRMIVTPTDPENAWRIAYDFFAKLAEEVVETSRSMGFMISLREAKEALVARGYRPSAPPPFYPTPPISVIPVIVTPTVTAPYVSPRVREIVVQPVPRPDPNPFYQVQPIEEPPQRWEPAPTYTPTPDPLPPVFTPTAEAQEADAQEAAAIDSNTVLMIVAGLVGGLALARMMNRGR